MPCIYIKGPRKKTNTILLEKAVQFQPSLLIDCSRAANPYRLRGVGPEDFQHVYVIEVEMLYKLRDVVDSIPCIIHEKNIRTVVITDWSSVFHYQNEYENRILRKRIHTKIDSLNARVFTVSISNLHALQ